jgi:hypothetical protein
MFIVASTDVEPAKDDSVRFFREYPGLDLPVIISARLSASSPTFRQKVVHQKAPKDFAITLAMAGTTTTKY